MFKLGDLVMPASQCYSSGNTTIAEAWYKIKEDFKKNGPFRITSVQPATDCTPVFIKVERNIKGWRNGRGGIGKDVAFVAELLMLYKEAEKPPPTYLLERKRPELSLPNEWLDEWVTNAKIVSETEYKAMVSDRGETSAEKKQFLATLRMFKNLLDKDNPAEIKEKINQLLDAEKG